MLEKELMELILVKEKSIEHLKKQIRGNVSEELVGQLREQEMFINSLSQDSKLKTDTIDEKENTIQHLETKINNMKFNIITLTQELQTAKQELSHFVHQSQEKEKNLVLLKQNMEIMSNNVQTGSAVSLREKEKEIGEMKDKLDITQKNLQEMGAYLEKKKRILRM